MSESGKACIEHSIDELLGRWCLRSRQAVTVLHRDAPKLAGRSWTALHSILPEFDSQHLDLALEAGQQMADSFQDSAYAASS